MASDRLNEELDRLSRAADPAHFDQAEWDRTQGAVQHRVATALIQALDGREDFSLRPEPAADRKQRLLLTHNGSLSLPVANIYIQADGHSVSVWAESASDTWRVRSGPPCNTVIADADDEWADSALREILKKIERRAS